MTEHINHLAVSRFIAELEDQILELGIHLELRTDFGYLLRLSEKLEDKPYPTAMFNPLHHHIGPENGFWIKGTNNDGDVVHIQAVRYDDLTGTNLARECENLTSFYFDPKISAEDDEWCKSYAPIAKQITGPSCYHGEVWLRKGEGKNDSGFRGKGLASLLARLGMAIALLKWNPNYIYGYVYPALILNGVMANYGYSHFQPSVLQWHRPSREKNLDVWIIWMARKDLMELTLSTQERDIDIRGQIGQAHQNGGSSVQIAAE